jgi:hypothetical protein
MTNESTIELDNDKERIYFEIQSKRNGDWYTVSSAGIEDGWIAARMVKKVVK